MLTERKLVAVIKDHPSVAEACKKMDAMIQTHKDQVDFLTAKLKQIMDSAQTEKMAIWAEVEARLADAQLYPPEYSKEQHGLTYDEENGLIFMVDKPKPNPLREMLQGLFT